MTKALGEIVLQVFQDKLLNGGLGFGGYDGGNRLTFPVENQSGDDFNVLGFRQGGVLVDVDFGYVEPVVVIRRQ